MDVDLRNTDNMKNNISPRRTVRHNKYRLFQKYMSINYMRNTGMATEWLSVVCHRAKRCLSAVLNFSFLYIYVKSFTLGFRKLCITKTL